MNPYEAAQHTAEALANGMLQGLVVLALVATALRLLPGMNAATRHAVLFTTLLLIAVLPVVHGLRHRGTADAGGAPAPAPVDLLAGEPGVTAAGPGPGGDGPGVQVPVGENAPSVPWTGPAALPGELEGAMEAVLAAPSPGWPAESPAEVADAEPAVLPAQGPAGPIRWGIPVSQGIAMALGVAWLIPAGLRLLRLSMEVAQVRRLKQASGPVAGSVQDCFKTLRTAMGVRRPVVVREGPADTVPFVAGFLHPMVVLPQGYATSHGVEDLVQVLRHELAHVRRRDDWSHLIEQALRAVLWFHPGVHWIVRRLSLEREIACDDHVLDASHSSRHYALLLTGFAGRRPGRDLVAAPAVWSRKTQLKERIAMILDSKRNASPRIARAMAGLLMMGTAGMTGLMLQAGPQLALVAPPSGDADANAPSTPPVLVAVSTEPDPAPIATPPPVVLAVAVEEGVTEPKVKTLVPESLPEPPEAPEAPEPPTPPAALTAPRPRPVPRPGRAAATVKVQVDRIAEVSGDASDTQKDKAKNKAKDKDKTRSLHAEGKDRGSLEERLDRLERMMETLLPREGAEWKAQVWAPDTTEFHWSSDPTAMARLAEAARRAAKDAKGHLPDADVMARVQREVETAVREGERTAREAVREAQRALREQQQAMGQSRELLTQVGKDARAQLERQRRELEAQQKHLEREMESLELRMERLEEESERLQELEQRPADDNRPKERKAAKSTATAGGSSAAASSADTTAKP